MYCRICKDFLDSIVVNDTVQNITKVLKTIEGVNLTQYLNDTTLGTIYTVNDTGDPSKVIYKDISAEDLI